MKAGARVQRLTEKESSPAGSMEKRISDFPGKMWWSCGDVSRLNQDLQRKKERKKTYLGEYPNVETDVDETVERWRGFLDSPL